MTGSIQIKLFQVFKEKFGERDATQIVEILEETIDNKFEEKKEILATKQDIADLSEKLHQGKVDTIKWVFGFFIALALMIIGLYLKK